MYSIKEPTYPQYILRVIKAFLRDRRDRYGTKSNCFTYKGLHSWYMYSNTARGVREELSWHTIERLVRRLAEDGFLTRIEKGRKVVIFCLNTEVL